MKVWTNELERSADKRAQTEFGLNGFELMKSAGSAVACRLGNEFPHVSRWCIVCGKGNNGGDGLVAAKELVATREDIQVRVVLMCSPEEFCNEARQAWKELSEIMDAGFASRISVHGAAEIPTCLRSCNGVLDAIFGIGLREAPSGEYARVIENINAAANGPVVALDVPSGIGAGGAVVRADLTVTIGCPKRDLVTYPGAVSAGRVVVEPILFPEEVLHDSAIWENWLSDTEAAMLLPDRPANANKGTFGRLMLVCGSASYAGAALFSATASHRIGTGLVYLASVRELNPVYKVASPETCTLIVPSADAEGFDVQSAPMLLEAASSMSAVVIGPGLGNTPVRREFVQTLLNGIEKPVVLDADGLNALSEMSAAGLAIRQPVGAQWVLTPHPGEAARLLGCDIASVQSDRPQAAMTLAKGRNAVVVLKGAGTVVAAPNGQIWYDGFASPVLARGGTGDVLSGIIGGLLAQGLGPVYAAVLAVRLLAMAGTVAADPYGERGVLTREIVGALPKACMKLQNHSQTQG